MGHLMPYQLRQSTVAVAPRALIEKTDDLLRPLFDQHPSLSTRSQEPAQLRDRRLPLRISDQVRMA